MAKRRKKKKGFSFVLSISFVCIVLYAVVALINLNIELVNKQKEQAALEAEYHERVLLNEELQRMLDSGNTEEYAKRVAREKLGLAFPDEKVYKVVD